MQHRSPTVYGCWHDNKIFVDDDIGPGYNMTKTDSTTLLKQV
jgi:hypothetical protein